MATNSQHNPLNNPDMANIQGLLMDSPMDLPLPLPDILANNMLASLYLTSAAESLIMPVYNPSMYITSWLMQYRTKATLIGVPHTLLGKFLSHYLLPDIAEWICVSSCQDNWDELVHLLTSTYGLDPEVEKAQRRRALQATTQGNLSIRLFCVKFATLANDMPDSGCLSPCTILKIFLHNIKPRLHQLIEPTLTVLDD
ncbi:hypothetical protein PHYBLDRAFT_70253 [Phycomyces blakesleeanus NRRL 1555(-)]|uniref:Retrotransposon gag domain-containing protein n=1 Tax=Phycomyces blakesleeanus (strain ATCC 8743b / DSM 1359 / FGSC 10004 / NBRC 33097 / NRRL 1555) TaxID=763407 RepID=A0A167JUZ4_PHYB8|nr:hypothetical protein PHYBLDRAFT_70253 [Phycomyces blakesleeanus NRRL 1555(-)]OAD66756.1 hypothetical protein PHYBLDRAFT_70253 [Phycomyces blakesleeanus NRRL 1555(-)]|eukprot:XP_018284796.1 hypothetical protein PHYBLDRAFT_70253 [Phycomyces blakesleeanus NRRL 1555(-)]